MCSYSSVLYLHELHLFFPSQKAIKVLKMLFDLYKSDSDLQSPDISQISIESTARLFPHKLPSPCAHHKYINSDYFVLQTMKYC